AFRLDAQVAAAAGGDGVDEIRPVGEIAADKGVRHLRIISGENDAVGTDEVERARVSLDADAGELAVEPVAVIRVGRRRERGAHVRIEGGHDWQMVPPAKLGGGGVGDKLHALLVNGPQRLEPGLAPQVLRDERRDPDGAGGANEQTELLQASLHRSILLLMPSPVNVRSPSDDIAAGL